MADLVVAGAGMAGLVAAAQARSHGAHVVVHEKGHRLGGSMRLSSGVVWRHRTFELFRSECPRGDEALQRLVFERLDEDLRWLEAAGAPVLERETGNPRTVGVRFDMAGLTECLVDHSADVLVQQPLREIPDGVPVVLATGGFAADRDLVREHITPQADHVLVRATPWSTGDGLQLARAAGAALTDGLDEFYGRSMPAPPARIAEDELVSHAQLYAKEACVVGSSGETFETAMWSEIDVVQWMARQPGASARFVVPAAKLGMRVGRRTIGEMVDAAERAGAPVERTSDAVSVEVVAGITSTLGGVEIDLHARAAPGLFVAGSDAGGVATGGYASGLAAALVLGRIAADAALGIQ
jgi:fumarate reductase flavoprotein subunit